MRALEIIIPIYSLLFVFYGIRNLKGFLLLTGIVSIPFRITYSIIDVGAYAGWTSGIIISLSDISFIVLFLYVMVRKKSSFMIRTNLAAPVFFFVGACVLSIMNSTWIRMTIYQIIMVIQAAFLYYFVLVNSIDSEKDLRLVVLFLILSLILQNLFAIMQFYTGSRLDYLSTGRRIEEIEMIAMGDSNALLRAVGTIGRPNSFAEYVVPILLLSVAVGSGTGEFRKTILIALILGSLGLLFSFSRGGWISFICSLAFLIAKKIKLRGIRASVVVFLFLIALGIFILFGPEIEMRVYGDDHNAAASRIPLIKIAYNMIQDHPLFGIGTNTFRSVIRSYAPSSELQGVYLHVVHNQYLLVFAESGLIGLMSFLWLMFSFFRESSGCAKRSESRFAQFMGVGITAGFLAIAIHMMFDIYCSMLQLSSMFVFCSLCSAAKRINKSELPDAKGMKNSVLCTL